jgi:hypothetical protein
VRDLGRVDGKGRIEGPHPHPPEESDEVGARIVTGNEDGKRHVPEANPPPWTGYSPPFCM